MKMTWVITAMLLYHGVEKPIITDYLVKSFDTKFDCLDYVWDNKVDMIDGLLEVHREVDGVKLRTFAFYCENRFVELEEV
jgi:hypothetical protein|tara:strand:+ start:2054 stop:2293 length:240 start_codon:yes stop_codon:yes gene_type:complete